MQLWLRTSLKVSKSGIFHTAVYFFIVLIMCDIYMKLGWWIENCWIIQNAKGLNAMLISAIFMDWLWHLMFKFNPNLLKRFIFYLSLIFKRQIQHIRHLLPLMKNLIANFLVNCDFLFSEIEIIPKWIARRLQWYFEQCTFSSFLEVFFFTNFGLAIVSLIENQRWNWNIIQMKLRACLETTKINEKNLNDQLIVEIENEHFSKTNANKT